MRPVLFLRLLCVTCALAVAACGSVPERVPYTRKEQSIAVPVAMPGDVRTFADAPARLFAERLTIIDDRLRRTGEPLTMLALSGGADDGAYGAGFLNGWTESGRRPEFTAVTGISTGALIAPYAFLGPQYDPTLKEIFTDIDANDVFIFRGLGGLFGSGIASSAPLKRMIDRHVTPQLLKEIAAEHEKGRVLLVATTNLDAQRGVIWNMGAIAQVGTPEALALFRNILLASASVPALFPPTLIDVEAAGRRYYELHVDGGATRQVLTLPSSILVSQALRRVPSGSTIYMVINNKLRPDFEVVEAATLPIAARSISTLVKASAQQSVQQTYDFARERHIGFQLTYIGDDFTEPYARPFNQKYMRALFAYGVEQGRAQDRWDARPPFSRR